MVRSFALYHISDKHKLVLFTISSDTFHSLEMIENDYVYEEVLSEDIHSMRKLYKELVKSGEYTANP